VNGGRVGELMFTVMKRQFAWLCDGDRCWYTKPRWSRPSYDTDETVIDAGRGRQGASFGSRSPTRYNSRAWGTSV
jgi:hypothetical protein